jgi:hypothetical protein
MLLVLGPVCGWLIGHFISDAMNVVGRRTVAGAAWSAAIPGICGYIGLLIVLLVCASRDSTESGSKCATPDAAGTASADTTTAVSVECDSSRPDP